MRVELGSVGPPYGVHLPPTYIAFLGEGRVLVLPEKKKGLHRATITTFVQENEGEWHRLEKKSYAELQKPPLFGKSKVSGIEIACFRALSLQFLLSSRSLTVDDR